MTIARWPWPPAAPLFPRCSTFPAAWNSATARYRWSPMAFPRILILSQCLLPGAGPAVSSNKKGHPALKREMSTILTGQIRHPGASPGCLFFFVQRRRDTEARQGVRAAGLHEKALSLQHSAVSQTRAIAGSAVLHGYGPTTTNGRAIHFSIDSKQKVKYHHLMPTRCWRHLWHRDWDTPGMR